MYKAKITFDKKLKKFLVGDEDATFIYINNFEVEDKWQSDETLSLPNISLGNSPSVVNRMEELGIFLAEKNDFVVLKDEVDPDYKGYLKEQGFQLPNLLYVERNYPEQSITQNILNCPNTISTLSSLKGENIYLMPFGTSKLEEELSHLTGIALATPPTNIFKTVNSKIFSRLINKNSNLNQIPGASCESLEELEESFLNLKYLLDRGECLVIKDALGVSGKGIVVIDSERKFYQYYKLLDKASKKSNSTNILMVIEQWIDKCCDLNFQFILSKQGDVDFNFVKESLVVNGVHQGHIIPSRLNQSQIEILKNAAIEIGKHLHECGYHGVVGVDGILSEGGILYPNLEINARFNMSTYQTLIQEYRISESKVAIAKKVNLTTTTKLQFKEILSCAGDLLYNNKSESGILITNFATVNATRRQESEESEGRLYFMIIEGNVEKMKETENIFMERVSTIEGVRI